MKKGIFVEADNGPVEMHYHQNEKILELLRKKYEIITYNHLEHAAYQMTHNDAEKCRDALFLVTNIPYKIQLPTIAAIKAEKIRQRLEGLKGEEREREARKITKEREFDAYSESFECLRKIREAFPKLKIIAYTAAHENVRKKVHDEGLVFRVHQRGHKSGAIWEKNNLIHGIEAALEGWSGCE
jgi:hypothetical protein